MLFYVLNYFRHEAINHTVKDFFIVLSAEEDRQVGHSLLLYLLPPKGDSAFHEHHAAPTDCRWACILEVIHLK